jgi:hypothetical protein
MSPAAPNPHIPVPGEAVADLPAREPHAQARVRAREAGPMTGPGIAWAQRAAAGAFTGSSLHHAVPMTLAQWWAMHTASARYFEAGLFRWPRYAYGAVHYVLAAVLLGVIWMTGSLPRLVLLAAVIAVGVWLI